MKRKIVSLLLVFLVALSVICYCSGTVLSSRETQSDDVVSSRTSKTTEKLSQNERLSFRGPNLRILGDPIDDPKPHKK